MTRPAFNWESPFSRRWTCIVLCVVSMVCAGPMLAIAWLFDCVLYGVLEATEHLAELVGLMAGDARKLWRGE
jgi:hypothetical protein